MQGHLQNVHGRNLGTDGTLHRFIMSMLCLGPSESEKIISTAFRLTPYSLGNRGHPVPGFLAWGRRDGIAHFPGQGRGGTVSFGRPLWTWYAWDSSLNDPRSEEGKGGTP
jgi:hypothetical protein